MDSALKDVKSYWWRKQKFASQMWLCLCCWPADSCRSSAVWFEIALLKGGALTSSEVSSLVMDFLVNLNIGAHKYILLKKVNTHLHTHPLSQPITVPHLHLKHFSGLLVPPALHWAPLLQPFSPLIHQCGQWSYIMHQMGSVHSELWWFWL